MKRENTRTCDRKVRTVARQSCKPACIPTAQTNVSACLGSVVGALRSGFPILTYGKAREKPCEKKITTNDAIDGSTSRVRCVGAFRASLPQSSFPFSGPKACSRDPASSTRRFFGSRIRKMVKPTSSWLRQGFLRLLSWLMTRHREKSRNKWRGQHIDDPLIGFQCILST